MQPHAICTKKLWDMAPVGRRGSSSSFSSRRDYQSDFTQDRDRTSQCDEQTEVLYEHHIDSNDASLLKDGSSASTTGWAHQPSLDQNRSKETVNESDEEPLQSRLDTRPFTSAGRPNHGMLYSPSEEKAVLEKLDRRLVAFLAFLYMLSFLDRSSE